MGDDDIIVTTFYFEGEVSIHWDRRTGELASLYMNSTLFPDDLPDVRVPLDSSAVASLPSVDDNCNMLPSMSESVGDVNPDTTSSTTRHRPCIHELDCAKSSCTDVDVYPDVTSSNTTLRPHTHYIDCAQSSCTNAGEHPCTTLSNNTRKLPTHDRDSTKSSCTNVSVHPLATSSNTEHRLRGQYGKSSSTTVDVNPHVSSTSIHRPSTHEQDCTKSSCEPHNAEEKGSPECSSMQSKNASISCKPQAVEREGIDSSNGHDLVTPQVPNRKHTGCKPLAVISSSKDTDPFEHKNPVSSLEGAKMDAKRIDGNTITLPSFTYNNPSTALTLSSTEKKAPSAPSNLPHADAKSTASTLSLHEKKAPSLPSDLPTTDAMHGPSIAREPSREVNLPSMELPAQYGDQTTYMGTSLGNAKSLPPIFSIKKTSPVSPRTSTGHPSKKASKRPRKGDISSNLKVEATVEEKPDPLLHESVTQHRKIKARKRPREVDLTSKADDSSPLQQLVLANLNHIPHYLDGPGSGSTSKDTSILNSRDIQHGRSKRRKTFQLSFRPMGCCRPRNAFIFFSMGERQKVAAANPHFTFGEISKLVAWSWHNMSDADKKPYRMLAIEDESRYHNKVSERYQTWEHLAERGLQILNVVDLVCEWLSQKLPRWAKSLSRSSLGSNSS